MIQSAEQTHVYIHRNITRLRNVKPILSKFFLNFIVCVQINNLMLGKNSQKENNKIIQLTQKVYAIAYINSRHMILLCNVTLSESLTFQMIHSCIRYFGIA